MDYTDPKLLGLKIILDDVSGALNWLAEQATGHHQAPTIHEHNTGHIQTVADFVDEQFGTWVLNTVVSGTVIDRGAALAFDFAAKNPRLRPILALKPFVTDMAKVGFSMGYREKTFGDAVTDRALSKYVGIHLVGWMPEAKSLAAATIAQSLRLHHFQ